VEIEDPVCSLPPDTPRGPPMSPCGPHPTSVHPPPSVSMSQNTRTPWKSLSPGGKTVYTPLAPPVANAYSWRHDRGRTRRTTASSQSRLSFSRLDFADSRRFAASFAACSAPRTSVSFAIRFVPLPTANTLSGPWSLA